MNININFMRSHKARGTLLMLAIFLISVWVLSIHNINLMKTDVQNMVVEQQFTTVSALAATLNKEMENRLSALKEIAKEVTSDIIGNRAALEKVLGSHPIFQSLFNGGTVLVNSDGIAVAEFPIATGRIGVNYMERDFVVSALKEGRAMIGRPLMGKTLKAPIVVMAVPILNAQGKVLGALMGVTDLSKPNFLDHITGKPYGKSGGFFVVNRQYRQIVTASDKSRIMEQFPATGIYPAIDRAINGYDGSFDVYVNPLGVEVLASAKGIPVAGWFLGVVLPTKEAFAPIRNIQQQILLDTIIFTLLAGSLSWWMLRRLDQQDEALKESEIKYRMLVETANEGIWISDKEHCLSFVNTRMTEMLGYLPEEMLGRSIVSFIASEDKDKFYEQLNLRQQGESSSNELFFERKDGSSICGIVSGSPLMDSQGIFNGAFAMITDITERKMAEAALRESEEKFAAAFRISPDPININSLNDGVFIDVNDKFIAMLGYSTSELLGRSSTGMDIWVNPDNREWLAQQLTENGFTEDMEAKLRRKDGVIIDALVSSRLIELNHQPCTLNIARDITEQKRIATELAAARDAAEAANRAKSEFLANMSHEIRTPMNGILGMAQLLEYTELSAQQKNYLDLMRISSENLLALISDILDLSKIEAGKVEILREEFSLRKSISDLVKSQISLIQGKGLSIRTDISADVPDKLIGDQHRLNQILLNLVANAIKFTAHGGITISATTLEKVDGSVLLDIAVSDTGIGIAPEHQQEIFSPFFQVDASSTRPYGGTGLGLSICRRLADLMGGSIRVESRDGIGSTLHAVISFAVNDGEVITPERGDLTERIEWPTKPLHILLAEDNEINLNFGMSIFKMFGHKLAVAHDGKEALAEWEKGGIDLILMDVQMPVMDGVEATRTIRAREQEGGGHTLIIAMTAYAMREDHEKFLSLGFDGYVSKPFQIQALKKEILRCLHAQEWSA